MVRPLIDRKVAYIPEVKKFIPLLDNHQGEISNNTLLLEEIEAIRLKDFEGLDQQECAELMNVSRPTFRRILLSAHEKISDSLLNGKSITIDDKTENINIVKTDSPIGFRRKNKRNHGCNRGPKGMNRSNCKDDSNK